MELKKIQGSATFEAKVSDYVVTATLQYDADGNVTAVNSGTVRKETAHLVNFSHYINRGVSDNYSVNFMGVEAEERQTIMGVIDEFVAEAKKSSIV